LVKTVHLGAHNAGSRPQRQGPPIQRRYAQAAAYRTVDRNDITASIPAGGSGGCRNGDFDAVAIVGSR
jgi:hypothetical protein